MQPQDTWTSLPVPVLLLLLAKSTDQGFLNDKVHQFYPCLFWFRRCQMHVQSYLMCAGVQILRKKAETNYQRIAHDFFAVSNRGTFISLAAFVNSIHVNNEKERRQNTPLQESYAHIEWLWLLAIYLNAYLRSAVEWLNGAQQLTIDATLLQNLPKYILKK